VLKKKALVNIVWLGGSLKAGGRKGSKKKHSGGSVRQRRKKPGKRKTNRGKKMETTSVWRSKRRPARRGKKLQEGLAFRGLEDKKRWGGGGGRRTVICQEGS